MKVIIKILSGLIILTVLGISGLFGYSKFKETEDLKKQLTEQKQIKLMPVQFQTTKIMKIKL